MTQVAIGLEEGGPEGGRLAERPLGGGEIAPDRVGHAEVREDVRRRRHQLEAAEVATDRLVEILLVERHDAEGGPASGMVRMAGEEAAITHFGIGKPPGPQVFRTRSKIVHDCSPAVPFPDP